MQKKPGFKTTEFWLTLVAMLLSAAGASGLVVEGSAVAQVIGFVSAALASLGYAGARAFTKTAEAKVDSAKELAKAPLK